MRRNSFLCSARSLAPGLLESFFERRCRTGRNGLLRSDRCADSVKASTWGIGILSSSDKSGREPFFGERIKRGSDLKFDLFEKLLGFLNFVELFVNRGSSSLAGSWLLVLDKENIEEDEERRVLDVL